MERLASDEEVCEAIRPGLPKGVTVRPYNEQERARVAHMAEEDMGLVFERKPVTQRRYCYVQRPSVDALPAFTEIVMCIPPWE